MDNMPVPCEDILICWDCYLELFADPDDVTCGRGEWHPIVLNLDHSELCGFCYHPYILLSTMEDIG